MLSKTEFRACIVEMIRLAETRLPRDVVLVLERCKRRESDRMASLQFECMLKNLRLARKLNVPICQDTGIFTFFVKLGSELQLDFDLVKEVGRGVEEATKEIPLRANLVDPLTREADARSGGQPTVLIEPMEGKGLQIELLVKGAGAENWSRLHMLKPTSGMKEIKRIVLETIRQAGGQPCPPTIVGVGIGGSAEGACIFAEEALLRPLDEPNRDARLAELERELFRAANDLGIGPMGLGGRNTVLGVHVVKAACHTASLPVAVSLQCWAARRASARLSGGRMRIEVP